MTEGKSNSPPGDLFRQLVAEVEGYAIFLLDADGRVASWNAGAGQIKGYTPQEILGQHFSRFYTAEDVRRGWPVHGLETAAKEGRFEDEGWRVRKDGSRFWASVIITALRDQTGALSGFAKITRDLTERKRHEGLLQASEERFRLLAEGVTDYAIFMLDPSGHITSWNKGAEIIKGYKREEILGRHFSCFYTPVDIRRRWPQYELEVAAATGRFEDEGWRVRKDGSRFWADVVITALRDGLGALIGYSKITRDLTERRLQQERLRESEERFRLLVEGVTDYAIYTLDSVGHVVTWNKGAERILGYSAAEIVGQRLSCFYSAHDVAQRKPERELETALERGRFQEEGWRQRKDGSLFWATDVVTVLHDHEGRLRGFAKVTRDMTELKNVEATQESGRRMSEFLAMLAHELRNPLAPIRNALAVMQILPSSDPNLRWSRDVIDRQVTHLTRLVDDLLDVGRITSGNIVLKREALELGVVVARGVEASRPLIDARKHVLEVSVPPEPLFVSGDLTRLTQVVVNLLNNAARFTPEGGRVWLRLAREGEVAALRVEDAGIGISSALLPLVFEPFTQGDRSLDRPEGGLGIGLTLVRRLVELHDGTVEASSKGAGLGSEFVVRLPLVPWPATRTTDDEVRETVRAGAAAPRRVLVVDDNVDSAESLAILLRFWGEDVRETHDGPGALAIAAEWRPEVVLLDIGLPGMDGYEVAQRLRSVPGCAAATLIAMTGYGQETDREHSSSSGFAHHLLKPVEPAVLREMLASLEDPSRVPTD